MCRRGLWEKRRKPETLPALEMAERKTFGCYARPTPEEHCPHRRGAPTQKQTHTNTYMSVKDPPPHTHTHSSPLITAHAQSKFSKQIFGMFVFHSNITWKGVRGGIWRGRGGERRAVLFKEPGGRNFMQMWGKHTTQPFFIREGKQGPHHHCLIITSMKARCERGGMRRRRKRNQEEEKKQEEKDKKIMHT